MAKRNKKPKYGINLVDDLYLPHTETMRTGGKRGGFVPVMTYWGHGYPSWEQAKRAMNRGPGAEPLASAVDVDAVTGRRVKVDAAAGAASCRQA